MRLLRIEGRRPDLVGLGDVPGVQVVGPSALNRGDGSWLVSAYATDEGEQTLRDRGANVRTLKDHAQVESEWAEAVRTDRAGLGYLTSDQMRQRLDALASAHGDICESGVLAHRTHEGREVPYVRIGSGPATVLVLGGVHAREWAPPDALLSLAEGLVQAYADGGSYDHPSWQDRTAQPPIGYAAWGMPAEDVQRLFERTTLVLVPMVNPDGRDYSLAAVSGDSGQLEQHRMWRKNRRPAPAGSHGASCYGVDLNRNFDIAWDFDRYYTAGAAQEVQSSKNPCDQQIYIGPSAASEPETLNVQSLVAERRPTHFMDVHAYARDILFPWGMDDDQGVDTSQSFHNPDWDRSGSHGGRDGAGGSYGEYLPSALAASHQAVGRRMHDAIRDQAGPDPRARRRSTYDVKQALGLYPTTGTSDDFCAGVTMGDLAQPPILAFCLECGIDEAPDDPLDNEGGFHPDRQTKFPKIEREVHAAVLALVGVAAG